MQEDITRMGAIIRTIKNRIKSNLLIIILFVLLFFSLFGAIKFSKIIVWGFLPNGIKNIFICPEEETDAYEIWSFINNISLAYVASFVFYFVVEYVPMKVKEKKAFNIVSNKLITIYGNLSYIIRVVLFEIDEKKNLEDIRVSDLVKVTTVFFNSETKYADITHVRNGKDSNSKEFSYDVLDKCKNCGKRINNTIDEIFSMQIAGNISDELVELLSEIRQSRFLSMLSSFDHENTRKIPGHERIALNFDKSFFEIIKYRERLGNYKFDLLDYRFEKMSDGEICKERENRIYYLGRSIFMHVPIEKIHSTLSYMPNIKLDEQKFHKLNGVLMEALVTYDLDSKQYGYILSVAKKIAEFLCAYEGSEECRDIALLNYMQVLRRIGSYSKKHYQPAKAIISNNDKPKEYRLGALIIVKNFAEAQKVFYELDENQQKHMTSLPIYRLWDNPPVPPNLEQPNFCIYE